MEMKNHYKTEIISSYEYSSKLSNKNKFSCMNFIFKISVDDYVNNFFRFICWVIFILLFFSRKFSFYCNINFYSSNVIVDVGCVFVGSYCVFVDNSNCVFVVDNSYYECVNNSYCVFIVVDSNCVFVVDNSALIIDSYDNIYIFFFLLIFFSNTSLFLVINSSHISTCSYVIYYPFFFSTYFL
jgi:hypothetical protein